MQNNKIYRNKDCPFLKIEKLIFRLDIDDSDTDITARILKDRKIQINKSPTENIFHIYINGKEFFFLIIPHNALDSLNARLLKCLFKIIICLNFLNMLFLFQKLSLIL